MANDVVPASSCGGAGTVDKASGSKDSLDPTATDIWKACWAKGLRLHPHQDNAKLFQHHHTKVWYVVHLTTLERVPLPPGEAKWDLSFDDDGYGGAVDDSVPMKFESICLELLFKKALCETVKGHEPVVYDQSGSSPVVWTLASRLKRFVPMTFTFQVGAMAKDHKHPGFAAAVPRGGCRHFWNALELYDALKLETYKGKASKWVYETMPAWCDQVSKMGFQGSHCLPSRRAEDPQGKIQCRDVLKDMIHGSAVSTCCLLQLLVRWSSMKPNLGGLRSTKAQAAALSMLHGLLASTLGVAGDWTLPVHFQRGWKCQWPCLDTRAADVALHCQGDIVDVQSWADLPDERLSDLGEEWLREVQLAGGGTPGKVAMSQLLVRLAGISSCSPLLHQLIWTCTIKVEIALLHALNQGPRKGGIHVTTTDIMSLLWKPKLLAHELFKYQQGCRDATKDTHCLSFSTDKAQVTGFGMCNTVFALADNRAIIAVPQAC